MTHQLLSTFATTLAHNDHWDGPGAWWPIIPLLWFLRRSAPSSRCSCGPAATAAASAGSRAGEARLAERFAAGEITEQEYRDRLAVLEAQAR